MSTTGEISEVRKTMGAAVPGNTFIGRWFGLMLALALVGLPYSAHAAKADVMAIVTSKSTLNPNDSLPWSQLGVDATMLSATFNVNSLDNLAVTGSLAASGSLVAVVCPASSCSWGSPGSNGFLADESVIWTSDTSNGGTGPLKLSFGSSVQGVGAFIQADGPAIFTAQIQAYNGKKLLKTFTATSDAGGDAVFLGALDNTAANIGSVVYSITRCSGACSDFALDTVYIKR
jgi:hypothetical protein